MEIVTIEKKTFEAMLSNFEYFVDKIETVCSTLGDKKLRE